MAKTKHKFKEWLSRYIVAELLGTLIAVVLASVTYANTKSYILGASAGFVGEGIGFYGYFITFELVTNAKAYRRLPFIRRFKYIFVKSSTNLIVEFAPAEIIDNLFIRPFFMFYVPQFIHPYALGFVIGKIAADILFYVFAIIGYEYKKKHHMIH